MEMVHRTVRIAVSINKITHFTRMDTLIDVFYCNTKNAIDVTHKSPCCVAKKYTLRHIGVM